MRLAPAVAVLTLLATMLIGGDAHARVRPAPDLPPSDQASLARLFDPELAPLGLRTTRAALQDPGGSYERSATGTHLAVYVEPTAEGEVDRADYVRNIMKVARVFLPSVYRRWSDLKTFDVCQEPEPSLDPRPVPIPVTQLIASRKGAAQVRWKRADLATLLERAEAVDGKKGGADPLSLYVSPRVGVEPLYRDALRRAGLAQETASLSR